MNGEAVQAAQDTVRLTWKLMLILLLNIYQPSPLWIVKHEATKETSDCERSLNAKIYRSSMTEKDINLDAKYGMSVEINNFKVGYCQ